MENGLTWIADTILVGYIRNKGYTLHGINCTDSLD